ncbi:13-hydroxylupanine O-tigloyltransferase-like [Dioscorea cayenensis subsp. rotundata]|uniref:13-hydroxylupanine O-tigloyltransferase-like n=1 Tax=Dioscorea cayennensis subsp. rotundata TaxID=55577 RepID=A0AB40CSC3_DIOCR|nr:13-hydroxylupanine O-tigloyltransferase-like [Dioscorea cayenensis subsp. rotundata]
MAKLRFPVMIGEAELILPDSPTPVEFKYLSNLDDLIFFRHHMPFIHYYNSRHEGELCDPAAVIRRALSKALVHYYPLAGRLRHGENGKLVVDCCAEGVVFRDVEADVTLEQLKMVAGGLRPPSPYLSEFLVDDVKGGAFVTDSPLLCMQVTRLKCGGFVLAYRVNHCICDAYGAFQFIKYLSELVREPNRSCPTQPPVWSRELLVPNSTPCPLFPHTEYHLNINSKHDTSKLMRTQKLTQTSIFLTGHDVFALKSKVNKPKTTTFEVITALLWRAWACFLALDCETRLVFPIDTRRSHTPVLPVGYYGVALITPCTIIHAKRLVSQPLSFAVGLISELKSKVVDHKEYRTSAIDFIEMNGRSGFCNKVAFAVSDLSKLRFDKVDMGWGQCLYGGFARAGVGDVPGLMVAPLVRYKREEDGLEGLLAIVSLPPQAVDVFQKEVRRQIDSSYAFTSSL